MFWSNCITSLFQGHYKSNARSAAAIFMCRIVTNKKKKSRIKFPKYNMYNFFVKLSVCRSVIRKL